MSLTSGEMLARVRSGAKLTSSQQLRLVINLSFPAMMAQLSSVVMQYIDASMVGQLGANDSAAIGLVSSSTWLFGGICSAAATGFTVLAAQFIGAGDEKRARGLVRQALVAVMAFCCAMTAIGLAIGYPLPSLLGGDSSICASASAYFMIYIAMMPFSGLNMLCGGMLESSGNMRVPGALNVLCCVLDVVFNALLIFPSRAVELFGATVTLPGAGMGVAGAALGTLLSEAVVSLLMFYFLAARSDMLHMRHGERLHFVPSELKSAVKISLPVGFEQIVICGAMIMTTRIISPLGNISIAANSFAVTAESLCYMPGFGIASAASALIGQSIGASRRNLTIRFAWVTTAIGMTVMTMTGIMLYFAAPFMMSMLSSDAEIQALGVSVLRIEAFAEPLYAASIVASGALRGAGDTLVPSALNLFSMWAVRIPLAAILSRSFGLAGVWTAMCAELCVRGVLFLIRLASKRWLRDKK